MESDKDDIIIDSIYLKRNLHIKDEINCNLNFKDSVLFVPDYYGGPTRSVPINYSIKDNRIFLKTIESLPKKEFEEIFNFRCGEFKIGKIISLPLNCLINNNNNT